jgi:hypothetical protein
VTRQTATTARAGRQPPIQKTNPDNPLVVAAQLVAALAAAGGLVALGIQVRHARRAVKRDRTVAFMDRFISPEFAPLASRTKSFLELVDAGDAVEKIQAWEAAAHAGEACLPRTPRHPTAPKASKNDVFNLLSFFEIIGAAHTLGQLDEEAFMRTFGPAPVEFFVSGWWFVCWARAGQVRVERDSVAWSGFEDLVRRQLELDNRFKAWFGPLRTVRLLVLPDAGTAGALDWSLCARLSRALSEHRESHHVVTGGTFLDDGCAGGPVVSTVIAVPTHLSFDARAWKAQVERAEQMQWQLRRRGFRALEDLIRKLPPDVTA